MNITHTLQYRAIVAGVPPRQGKSIPSMTAIRSALRAAGARASAEAVDAALAEWEAVQAARKAKRHAWRKPAREGIVLPTGTPQLRLDALRESEIRATARRVLRHDAPAGDDWVIRWSDSGDTPRYTTHTAEDRTVYRGAWKGWAATALSHHVVVPRDWRISVQRRGLATVADALTLSAEPLLAADGVEAVSATVARQGRGYDVITERRTYARLADGPWTRIEETDLAPARGARPPRNAERAAIWYACYPGGMTAYLTDSRARRVHADETGALYRVGAGDEPLTVVVVRDPSTTRDYALRVPPATQTAREGVAWTFGLTAAEYHPAVET